ncbi:MAG: DNA-binding protein [Caulobacterales bacterium 68-7]|nr:DUF3140 domain-containing protein [Caulobacterales bacterium]OJU08467.1 MAG: DNA-binding protein [Caulobacterales bacterium 68-7]
MEPDDVDQVRRAFAEAVNMPPAQLERWLQRDESREVGWVDGEPKHGAGGKESVGHASGRRIVSIKRKKKAELTADDLAHMRKVVGYVHRHLAQRPDGDVSRTRWRYSLMNWGHDPLKQA